MAKNTVHAGGLSADEIAAAAEVEAVVEPVDEAEAAPDAPAKRKASKKAGS